MTTPPKLSSSLRSYLELFLDEMERLGEGRPALSWGYPALDEATGGYGPGPAISILAGEPGAGTSTFLLTPLLHAALRRGAACRLFVLEEFGQDIVERILSRIARVSAWRLKQGQMREADWVRIGNAIGALANHADIDIIEVSGSSLSALCAEVRGRTRSGPLDPVVFIDSLDRTTDWADQARRTIGLRELVYAAGGPVVAALRTMASPSAELRGWCETILQLHPHPTVNRTRLEILRCHEPGGRQYVDLTWMAATAELVEARDPMPKSQLAFDV